MMASRVPTISIKKIPIKNNNFYLTALILGSIIFGLIVFILLIANAFSKDVGILKFN